MGCCSFLSACLRRADAKILKGVVDAFVRLGGKISVRVMAVP